MYINNYDHFLRATSYAYAMVAVAKIREHIWEVN